MDSTELQREHIVKKGVLQRYSGSQASWLDKFYVLYKTSERNAARLDWYDSEEAFQTAPSIRKTLFIEEIMNVKRVLPSDDEIRHKFGDVGKNAIIIRKHRSSDDVVLLRATKMAFVNEWLKEINRLLELARTQSLRSRTTITDSTPPSDLYHPRALSHARSFVVEVDDTAAANLRNLWGQYRLVLTNEHVTLLDDAESPVLSWQYSYIRRYGFSGETFTLEGGHRAGPAAGLFIFKSCSGAEIRNAIEAKMNAIRDAKHSSSGQEYEYVRCGDVDSLSSTSSYESISSAPCSPAFDGDQKPPPSTTATAQKSKPPAVVRNEAAPPPIAPKPSLVPPGAAEDGSQSAVKMSQVVGQLRRAPPCTATTPSEYSSIDLVKTAGARATPRSSGDNDTGAQTAPSSAHVYGPLLVQKQTASQESESTYAEIDM